MVFAVQWLIKS